MEKIGLIDVDNRERLRDCFPNIPLMKISAWHKSKGDLVEWYNPMFGGHYDVVYMSKVFSFTDDYEYFINADRVIRGGTGYGIRLEEGREVFHGGENLPPEIEHIFPDYSLYYSDFDFDVFGKLTTIGIKHRQTAYGFLSRGCPRGCKFCHVKPKEGGVAVKVADLSEFWNGQKIIELCDPNTLACKDYKDILQQLIDSNSRVNFNQGLDIRLMTEEKAEMINQIKIKGIHFAWDKFEDMETITPKFLEFRKASDIHPHELQVYVLTNFNTTHEQDLFRVEWLRNNGFAPYIMIYNKQGLPKKHITRKLQRYVNNRTIFWSCKTFEEYRKNIDND